jgi:hypothetical protein
MSVMIENSEDNHENVTALGEDVFVVAAPSSTAGWRLVNGWYSERAAARVAAAGIDRALVLPALKTGKSTEIDWTEAALAGARDPNGKWIAIRVGNGGLKIASTIPEAPYETLLETVIERHARRLGIPILLPADMTAVKHHRTNRMIAKRFPFLSTYAFVRAEGEKLDRLRQSNYVASVLRKPGGEGFVTFSHEYLVPLFVRNLEVVDAIVAFRAEQAELGRKLQREALNKQLGSIFPKGRRKRIPIRMLAEGSINSLPPRTKQRCQDILKELRALDNFADSCNSPGTALHSAA